MTKKSLFFLAVIVPEPVATEARSFQQAAAELFASKASLRSPPHITLVPPFAADLIQLQIMSDLLAVESKSTNPFEIVLNGFGRFGRKVIFINVEISSMMKQLALRLNSVLREYGFDVKEEHREFHPHLTVAFKDLRADQFAPAWKYFEEIEYHKQFNATGIGLLQNMEGRWMVVRVFPFGEMR